jgi:hypothetical protein
MKKLVAILCFVAFATPGFSQTVGQLVQGEEYRGVIFPAQLKHNPTDSVGRWTPTVEDIQTLEKNLQVFMDKQPKKSIVNQSAFGPEIHKQLGNYIRQYTGFISPKGEKMIYVNCFYYEVDDPFTKDYDRRLITVFDGGSSFLRIYYNVSKQKFVGLSVNGVA